MSSTPKSSPHKNTKTPRNSPQKPHIPLRTSSKDALNQKILQAKQSQQQLKHKLPASSQNSLEYKRLRIDCFDAELEEYEAEKTSYDLDYENSLSSKAEYRKFIQIVNRKIIELGSEKWSWKRKEREQMEKEGLIEPLHLDTAGAFNILLLALWKDPPKSMNKVDRTGARRDCIDKYKPEKVGSSGQKMWCPIAQDWFDKENMKAAHIVPARIDRTIIDYVFGSGHGLQRDTAINCLFINSFAETSFDKGNFVIIPVDANEKPRITRYKIVMTSRDATSSNVNPNSGDKLGKIDGQELKFLTDFRPAQRFLFFHFVMTRHTMQRDRVTDWEEFCLEMKTKKPWPTAGRYLRKSILPAMSEAVGDQWNEELFGDDGTFEVNDGLDSEEEREMARRLYEGKEKQLV